MKKNITLFVAMALFGAVEASAQTPAASNITTSVYSSAVFHDMTVEEGRILNPLFATYITANPGVKIKTSLVDLEGKGVASIAVKFVSPSTCSTNLCYYSLLRFQNNKWNNIMVAPLDTLEVETAASRSKRASEMSAVKINGVDTWIAAPDGIYKNAVVASNPAQSTINKTLSFTLSETTPEFKIVKSLFNDMISKIPGAVLKVGAVDLDGDGLMELAVRIESPSTCSNSLCYTTILRNDNKTGKWYTVFEKRAATIVAGRTADGFNSLLVDNNEIWLEQVLENRVYTATLRGLGKEFWVTETPPPALLAAAVQALPVADREGLRQKEATMAVLVPSPGVKMFAVQIPGASCMPSEGCPTVFMMQDRSNFKPVYTGTVDNLLVVMNGSSNMQDIGIQQKEGYLILRWNGNAYVPYRTSYTSAITRSP